MYVYTGSTTNSSSFSITYTTFPSFHLLFPLSLFPPFFPYPSLIFPFLIRSFTPSLSAPYIIIPDSSPTSLSSLLHLIPLRLIYYPYSASSVPHPPHLSSFSVLWIRIHFLRIRIRIQSMMLETNTDPDPDPIRIQGFNDQKLLRNYS
jgi:hypothetical protein